MEFNESVSKLSGIGTKRLDALHKSSIHVIGDLLRYYPYDYRDLTNALSLSAIVPDGRRFVTRAIVVSCVNIRTRRPYFTIQKAILEDNTATCAAIFFNQPYLPNALIGKKYYFVASASKEGNEVTIKPIEWYPEDQVQKQPFIPKYSRIKGIPQGFIRNTIYSLLQNPTTYDSDLPENIRKKAGIIAVRETFCKIHTPHSFHDIEEAQKRIDFDALQQLSQAFSKAARPHKATCVIEQKQNSEFENSLPFSLTSDQLQAINESSRDMSSGKAMNRMLIGDVGSGKTVVAAASAFKAAKAGYKTIIFSPSSLLASQHMQTLSHMFKKFSLTVGLLTAHNKISKDSVPDVIVATHALLYEPLKIEPVGLIVIDEQHKFGVEQRDIALRSFAKGKLHPHVLSMSATPIPRPLALLLFKGISQSFITTLPPNRKPVRTRVIMKNKIEAMLTWIGKSITASHLQVYMVCPAIDAEDDEFTTVDQIKLLVHEHIPYAKVAGIHSRQKNTSEIMKGFMEGSVDILVSTTIIEVGIDVPNASIIVIFDADYFGLAQLHQLRGRVGRGSKESWCFLVPSHDKSDHERLSYLEKHNDGFAVSQYDLEQRGPGTIIGINQKGYVSHLSGKLNYHNLALHDKVSYTSPLVPPLESSVVKRLH